MKFKSTWIMLAVLAALGAYFYWVEEPRREAGRIAEEQAGLLFPKFEPEGVTELSLAGRRGDVRVKKGEDGRWFVVEPWDDRADDGRVRSLLTDLKDLRDQREVAGADADLASFGLTEPEVTVTATGTAVNLAVGTLNPAGDARYVRVGQGPVRLSPALGFSTLLGEAWELRSKELLADFPWDDLIEVEVRRPEEKTVRLRRSGETWVLEAPLETPADPDAVGRLTEKLRWARVARFREDDPARAEAALASGTAVALRTQGGETSSLRLALVDGTVWADRSGRDALFALASDVLDALGVPVESLRRRKPVLVEAWRLEALELDRSAARNGGEPLEYGRIDGLWVRGGDRVEGAEFAALQEYLSVLEAAAAAEVLDDLGPPSEYGLDEPVLSARLTDTDGVSQGFDLGLRGDALFARSIEGGPVYRMSADYLEKAQALFAAARPHEEPEAPEE